MDKQSRRQFLKSAGSIAIGAAFAGVTGSFLWKMFSNPEGLFHGNGRADGMATADTDADFSSPYRRTFGFETEDAIVGFDVAPQHGREREHLLVALLKTVSIYSLSGQLEHSFAVSDDIRDIAYYDDKIYLLFPSHIEVYDFEGHPVQQWQACSEGADYCALTVFEGGVFVTDASNKHICKYNIDGSLARFINSPEGFIVPSYCFGITHHEGRVYCSNPGRHKIEVYEADGTFVNSFGKAGTDEGAFSGCCNPVHLTFMQSGELLTSEKGVPRISCYGTNGTYHSTLLNAKMLGGGHDAYEVKVYKDKLIVSGGKKVQVFQYNSRAAANTMCGSCEKDCPMKKTLPTN